MKVMYYDEGYINKEKYFIVCDKENLIFVGNSEQNFKKFLEKNKIIDLQRNYKEVEKYFCQLNEYFQKDRKKFVFTVKYYGTDFQKRVWHELSLLKYGETISYKDMAKRLGNEKSSRAVASAIAKNPLLIFVPCHRVIGKNGSLCGYSGGIDLKAKLLNLEKFGKNN